MPKLRLTQYGYDFCVKCSDVQPKVGRIMTYGTGDHTYNELQVVDKEVGIALDRIEGKVTNKGSKNKVELINLEEDQTIASQSVMRDQASALNKAVENTDTDNDGYFDNN